MTGLWVFACLALAGLALLGAQRRTARRRQQTAACAQVLRTAREVRRMARLVDADLDHLAGNIRAVAYRERHRRLRWRADTALAHADCVKALSALRLRRALSRFQRDARELRQLRLELLAEMARSGQSRS